VSGAAPAVVLAAWAGAPAVVLAAWAGAPAVVLAVVLPGTI
jgi:hypothetical protein